MDKTNTTFGIWNFDYGHFGFYRILKIVGTSSYNFIFGKTQAQEIFGKTKTNQIFGTTQNSQF